MGGGIINFPTRFLRWIKIDGVAEGDDGGGGGDDGGDGGGGDEPTEFYIKFRADDFGVRNSDSVPDTVDRSKGYRLDEILDMSDNTIENFINNVESNIEQYLQAYSNQYALDYLKYYVGVWYDTSGDSETFNYFSYESGDYGGYKDGTCFPIISLCFLKQKSDYSLEQSTVLKIGGTNLRGWSWTPPQIVFEKNKDDGLWYIIDAN